VFAVLHASATTPLDTVVAVAQAFTPRFQVLGPLVLLDVGGLSALFGTPEELGGAMRAACPDCRAVALGTTASAALLLACGREGLTVLSPEAEKAALADLSLDVLVEVTEARLSASTALPAVPSLPGSAAGTAAQPAASGGWQHPRDTHQAHHTRRPRATATPGMREALLALQQCRTTLRRWGITRLGALAALPRADVHARLGTLGVSWQRLAAGEDEAPLVPWLAEPVFEELLELEWPVEGFEPLSFVLARVLEPLAARLEQADRGAVAIRTALHLTTRQVHVRVIPLPAPMRDPKTLRTLVLLDLESHPPPAAIDRVQVRLEPTPGRVLQWALFTRAQPAPEQVATLIARLTALMGEGHVGSPAVVDAWRPGVFAMAPFAPASSEALPGTETESIRLGRDGTGASGPEPALPLAFRRFRLPIPVRVRVDEGRPARLITDRRGVTGGAIVQAAGPWRTSGEWWGASHERPRLVGGDSAGARADAQARDGGPHGGHAPPWDRDEWDIAMADGTVYRLFVERAVGQWFLEGVFD
jgi:protein ImuB